VSEESFQKLSSYGGLKRGVGGYKVVQSFARRLKAGSTLADQHRDICHRDIYNPDGVMRPARVNRSLSAMDRLYKRRDKNGQTLLSDAEYEAGQRYARDYALAGYDVLATQNYILKNANSAIGKGLDKVIIAVCCLDHSLSQVERAEKWAAASGLTILKLGLSALADYYGTHAGAIKSAVKH